MCVISVCNNRYHLFVCYTALCKGNESQLNGKVVSDTTFLVCKVVSGRLLHEIDCCGVVRHSMLAKESI